MYMCVCVCVCVCLWTKQKKNIRLGQEMLRLCRVPMPFSPPRLRAAQQCSTHWSAHHRQAESHRSEDLPLLPVVFAVPPLPIRRVRSLRRAPTPEGAPSQQGRSQGVARGGRGHHGRNHGHPARNCIFKRRGLRPNVHTIHPICPK